MAKAEVESEFDQFRADCVREGERAGQQGLAALVGGDWMKAVKEFDRAARLAVMASEARRWERLAGGGGKGR